LEVTETIEDVVSEERVVGEGISVRCDGEGVERGWEEREMVQLVQSC
jgi:hypothetical protein